MKLIHRCAHRQNRVEVVAIPLQATLIEVAAVLHRDEFCFQEIADNFHHGVPGKTNCAGDGVVAGMAGMRPPILNQQQVGVDHKCRG